MFWQLLFYTHHTRLPHDSFITNQRSALPAPCLTAARPHSHVQFWYDTVAMAPHRTPPSMAKPNIQKRARIQDTDTDERINKNERVTKFKHEPQSTLVSSNALNTNTHGNLSATAATGESKNKSPGDQQFALHSIELPEHFQMAPCPLRWRSTPYLIMPSSL